MSEIGARLKAILRLLREPTARMVEEGAYQVPTGQGCEEGPLNVDAARACWIAMVDEALREIE